MQNINREEREGSRHRQEHEEGSSLSTRDEREGSRHRQEHEEGSSLSARDEDPMSQHAMRIASPLSVEEELVMRRTIGCAIAVHRALGPGFLESIYRKAMCIEFKRQGLMYESERPIEVAYAGIPICGQRIDLIVGGLVVVELKAVAAFEEIHRAQLISYLRTLGVRAGLLLNFRVRVMKDGIRRVILTQ
jgi:GxxExxY protein